MHSPGGTPGGIVPFCGGCALVGGGMWSLFSRVMVSSGGMWHGYFGSHYGAGGSIGATLLPFIAGVGVLFYNGKSWVGWALVAASLLGLVVEIITSLHVHLQPTPLPLLLVMLGAVGGGLGLIAKSLRAQ